MFTELIIRLFRGHLVSNGKSNESGFELMLNTAPMKISFQTREYEIEKNTDIIKINGWWNVAFYVCIALFLLLSEQFVNYQHTVGEVSGIILDITKICLETFLSVVIFAMLYFRFGLRETTEWHACEHKSSILLNSAIEPTIANLKKAPMTLLACGCSMLCLYLQTLIGLWFLFYLSAAKTRHEILFLIIIGFITSNIFAMYTATGLFKLQPLKLTRCLVAFILPSVIIPFFIEWSCALRNPSEEKLQQTSEDLQRFMAENHYLIKRVLP